MTYMPAKIFVVLVIMVAIVCPMAQPQVLPNSLDAQTNSDDTAELGPVADSVAPLNPDIQYSGDPDGAYSPDPDPAPTGPQTLIVLNVYFTDLSYSESTSTFNSLIFGNVSDYYQEVSYGQCSLSGTVAGWYNVGHTKAYYGADGATSGITDDANDDGSNDSWRLVDDALAAADPFVDFSSYGHIMVVHAGNGQESSGVSTDIWSVRWSWPGHFVTDEKTFSSCSIVPETQGGDVDRCIGVVAHEFGHDIGLPDLYHYGHAGEDDFVDQWGLMASGSWNGAPSGTSPAHPMAYSKIALEWLTNYYEFTSDSAYYNLLIYDQETYTTSPQAIKIITSSTSYYLVELRSNYGYDAYLPTTGVLISYVDETLGSGQGIVKVQDAHPGTTTLDDAAYQSGDCFLSDTLRIEIHDVSPGADYAAITVVWKSEKWIADQWVGSQSSQVERNPDIASDSSGNLYCAFEIWNVDWGTYVIEVRKSVDGGRTWNWLFAFGSSTYDSFNPAIAVDVGFYDTVFVVCEMEISASDHNIYGYAYNSTGAQFIYIDTDTENDRYPCIASEFSFGSGNYQYVAYERVVSTDDRDMVVQRSTDHGDTWSIVHQRGDLLDWNVYCDLSITCTRGSDAQYYVYVAYKFGADYASGYSVRVDASTNYGGSWAQVFGVGMGKEVHYPSIAAGHGTGTVVVGWHYDYSATDTDVYIAYSTDNGLNWNTQSLAVSTANEYYVDVGVDGQGLSASSVDCPYFHIVYRVGNNIIYRRASANRPNIWSSEEVVNSGNSASGVYLQPSVTGTVRPSGANYPAIVWTDLRGSYDIYYSTRGGTITVVTEPAGLIVELDSIGYTTPFSFERIAGMVVYFDAASIQSGPLGVRYVWNYWSYGSYIQSSQSMGWAYDPYDETITAHYGTEYYLTVSSTYGTPSGEGWYPAGTIAYAGLDIYSVPVSDGERLAFHNWTDDASGTGYWQSNSIIMDGPKTATAVWVNQYQWTLEYVGDYVYQISGWVDEGLEGYFGIYTAPPENATTRYIFSHWSGDVSGTNMSQSSSIIVNSPVWAYAHWTTQYQIIVVTDCSSTVSTGWYNKSLTVTVSVVDEYVLIDSGSRWRFDSWSGNTTGSSYSASEPFLVDGSKTIYANWLIQYFLTVDSAHGTTSGNGWYDSGLSAYASLNAGIVPGGAGARYVFLSWADDASGSSYASSGPIAMNGPKTALANWQTQYYLTVVSAHATLTGAGWYAESTLAYAGLDSGIVSGNTGERFVFQSWTGDASGSDYSWSDAISMDSPKTATADWATEYYLTVSSDHGTPSGEAWYVSGTIAYSGLDTDSISVATGEQIGFQSWSGDASGINYSQSDAVTMDGPKTATAVWATEFYLTVNTDHGVSSGEGWYVSGNTAYAGIDVTVIPVTMGEQIAFQSWSGDASGTNSSQSNAITMDGTKIATAVWATEHYLTLDSDHGTPSGEGWYVTGSTAYASLDSGIVNGSTGERFVFQSWSGAASGTNSSQSDAITMDGPKTVSIIWQTQYRLICITNPSGLTPMPVSTPTGEWFNNGTTVTLEAQSVSGYTFDYWDVDGSAQAQGVTSISVVMTTPHMNIACYHELQTSTTTATTTPTSTSPTETGPPPIMGDFTVILVIAGIAAGVVVVIVLFVLKKRNT